MNPHKMVCCLPPFSLSPAVLCPYLHSALVPHGVYLRFCVRRLADTPSCGNTDHVLASSSAVSVYFLGQSLPYTHPYPPTPHCDSHGLVAVNESTNERHCPAGLRVAQSTPAHQQGRGRRDVLPLSINDPFASSSSFRLSTVSPVCPPQVSFSLYTSAADSMDLAQNKVDISSLSEQDQKAFKMYGKIPGKNLLTKMQKERKYFDSGDYMMSKAGAPNAEQPGTAIPTPQHLPHASPPNNVGTPINLASSPTGNMPIVSPRALSPEKTPSLPGSGGVGVGISPAATSEAVEVPGMGTRHVRRGSESNQARISPPGTMREASTTSSYPIQHGAGFGSSPVKASSLANCLDEEMEG